MMGTSLKKMEGPGRRFLKLLVRKLELVIVVFDTRRQIPAAGAFH